MSWKDLAAEALVAAGVPRWYRRRNRGRLAILMYHGVVERPLPTPCWHQAALGDFRRQIEWVARSYRVLPLSTALGLLTDGELDEPTCAVTFDDGYANVADRAFPVLAELEVPSAVFLATGVVGTRDVLWPDRLYLAIAGTSTSELDLGPLGGSTHGLTDGKARGVAYADAVHRLKALESRQKDARLEELLRSLGRAEAPDPGDFRALDWDDVHRLSASGLVEFGAHTVHHHILSRLPDDAVSFEIEASHATVTARLGGAPAVFAYPNGRACDFDDRARDVLRRLGVRWALSTIEGLCDRATDPLALRRVAVGADLSYAKFRLHVSGALERRAIASP